MVLHRQPELVNNLELGKSSKMEEFVNIGSSECLVSKRCVRI